MKFDKKDLLAALKIANRVAGKSTSFPVLGYGKFADGHLHATNLEIGVKIPLGIDSMKNETFLLPLKQLTNIVRSLDSDTVEILAAAGTEGVKINGMFEIFGLPASEFPGFDIPKTTGWATVEKTALKNVLPAVSRDNDMLNGVYFDAEQQKCVATDGHRLHMSTASIGGNSFMLPANELNAVISSLGKDEDKITLKTSVRKIIKGEPSDPPEQDILDGLKKSQLISLAEDYFDIIFNDKTKIAEMREQLMAEMEKAAEPDYSEEVENVVIVTEKATFIIRPMEIRFPNYQSVLPENPTYTVIVKRGEFLAAVKQAITMTDAQYRAGKLTFNGKGIVEMESVNPDIGKYQRFTVPMVGHVEPAIEAGFNPFYLRDIMEVTKDDDAEFRLEINWHNSPLIFNHETFKGLVMPMRV